jgi:FMNH2-dependent dimethyl sulfone monooxygenase
MAEIFTCTWAPTALAVPQLTKKTEWAAKLVTEDRYGPALTDHLLSPVRLAEELGIDYLLVAQRWWGTGQEIEGSTYDCIAMTAFYAAHAQRLRLITAVHPGFFLPGPIAKWGATIDRLTGGRWAINLTTGWHEAEFGMYGAPLLPHDERYARTTEFIEILRGAWERPEFTYNGHYYQVDGLRLEPRPVNSHLEIFQGGQSEAAMNMASQHSDWMFLNGGPPEKIGRIIAEVRKRTAQTGRHIRFGLYAIPLCRKTDAQAEAEITAMVNALDDAVLERRKMRTSGAQGMWAPSNDRLTQLDTNEGFASRLIGSPDTILRRMEEFHRLGVDLFHLTLHDQLFNTRVLPFVKGLAAR